MPRVELTVGRFDHTKRWEIADLIAAVLQNIPESTKPLHEGEVCVIVRMHYPAPQ